MKIRGANDGVFLRPESADVFEEAIPLIVSSSVCREASFVVPPFVAIKSRRIQNARARCFRPLRGGESCTRDSMMPYAD